jgi:diguanylate cyclase (GGDEF)-like protein/PAS domain S-box-containing protein
VIQIESSLDMRDLYGAMIDRAPVAIFVHSDDRILFINQTGVRLLGARDRAEILGRSRFEFLHPEDRALSRERVALMHTGTVVPRIEQRYLRVDGTDVYGEAEAVAIDHQGRKVFIVFIRDVTERRARMDELRRARAAMELAPDPIFLTDRETLLYADVNAAACQLLGYPREEMLTRGVMDFTVGADRADFHALFDAVAAAGQEHVSEEHRVRHLRCRDGKVLPVEIRRSAVRSGGRDLIVSVARDLSERRRAEEALRLRDRAIEASDSAILLVDMRDPVQPIEYVNAAFERMTGYSAAESIGRNCRFLQRGDHLQPELERLREALGAGNDAHVLLRNYRKDGRLFWNRLNVSPVRDDAGAITHYVGIATDVTDLTADRHELQHRATHDSLTGLANRQLLGEQLELALAQAERYSRGLAVVFVDLDGFKEVNDTLGHAVGDAVLRIAARRLESCVRDGDTVARTGGDEFVLVLTDQTTPDRLAVVLERLRATLSLDYPVDGTSLAMSCSIGASIYPRNGTTSDALVQEADRAMYAAKLSGRNAWRMAT